MSPTQLRPEVEQAVARVDLRPAQREAIATRRVEPRLARHRQPIAGLSRELHLTLAVDSARERQRLDVTAELALELVFGFHDLAPSLLLVETREVPVGDGVRFETQRPATVELDYLAPMEERRRALVPVGHRATIDEAGRDEDRCTEAVLCEDRQGVLDHVRVSVVARRAASYRCRLDQ